MMKVTQAQKDTVTNAVVTYNKAVAESNNDDYIKEWKQLVETLYRSCCVREYHWSDVLPNGYQRITKILFDDGTVSYHENTIIDCINSYNQAISDYLEYLDKKSSKSNAARYENVIMHRLNNLHNHCKQYTSEHIVLRYSRPVVKNWQWIVAYTSTKFNTTINCEPKSNEYKKFQEKYQKEIESHITKLIKVINDYNNALQEYLDMCYELKNNFSCENHIKANRCKQEMHHIELDITQEINYLDSCGHVTINREPVQNRTDIYCIKSIRFNGTKYEIKDETSEESLKLDTNVSWYRVFRNDIIQCKFERADKHNVYVKYTSPVRKDLSTKIDKKTIGITLFDNLENAMKAYTSKK